MFDHGLRRLLHSARLVPVVVVLALLVAGASALVVTERGKLQPALVLGTRATKTFSPICRCSTAVAHVTFRLAQARRVTVQIVNSTGRPVATFLRDRAVRPGWKHFVWNGLNSARHVLPNGSYFPQVSFPLLHRTLRLPDPIKLDTRPPRLRRLAVRTTGSRIVVRYAFDGPARAVLFVDGRRAVFARRATATGRLIWDERFPDGPRVTLGRHRIWVVGTDAAGNRSQRSAVHVVGVRI